jgi:photosystem II stability/assembly factor-like uncharacterized protein
MLNEYIQYHELRTRFHGLHRLFYYLLLSFPGFLYAQSWHHQDPLPTAANCRGICFTGPNTGYVVGGGGTVLKSLNGGASWMNESVKTHNTLWSVHFTSSTTGFAVGDSGTILRTQNSGSDWSAIPSGTAINLRSIQFTDFLTGYIAGFAATMLKTTNGGASWTSLSTGSTEDIYSVSFPSADTGYAACSNGKLLKTTNAGNSWTTLSTTCTAFHSVFFINAVTGFAVDDGGHIARTTNGGLSWTYPTSGTTNSLNCVYFSNATTGFITGDGGTLLKTTNGGITWISQAVFGQKDLFAIRFTSSSAGIVCGEGGRIWKTVNGAASWARKAPLGFVNECIGGICFTAPTTGYAVGDSGLILKTTTSGATWVSLNSGTTKQLSGIHFPTATTGYAVGKSGKILKTTNGGTTWTNQPNSCVQWLKAVYFADNTHGCAVGTGGAILITANGGLTWDAIICMTAENEDVFFTSQSTGYIAVALGYIIKTEDGGVNWSVVYSGGENPLNSIHFPTAAIGYAVGMNGEILKTTNGGTSWNHLPHIFDGSGTNLYSVDFVSVDTGFVAGSNGMLARTVDGGQSWTPMNTNTDQLIYHTTFLNAHNGWLVGLNGFILHGLYPDRPVLPQGPVTLCLNPANSMYTINPVSGATSYLWSVTPGTAGTIQGTGTAAVVDWTNAFSGTAKVSVQALVPNTVGPSTSDSLQVTIETAPVLPGPVSGPDSVCTGSTAVQYSISPVPAANTYTWSVPAGASIVSGQNTSAITVVYSGAAATGNISVFATGNCGTSNPCSFPVTIRPTVGTAGPVSGPTLVCKGTGNISYSIQAVPNASGYSWTVPPGWAITGGQNSAQVIVSTTTLSVSGNVSVVASNVCGNSNASSIPVTVNQAPIQPAIIHGPDSVCPGSASVMFWVDTVANASFYSWSIPSGWTISAGQGTNSITIHVPANAIPGPISVSAGNACGNSAVTTRFIMVRPYPLPAGPISGSTLVCAAASGMVYSINPVTNATGYSWVVPVGNTITGGQNTPSVTVSFGSFPGTVNISVHAINGCGEGPGSSLPVTIAAPPVADAGVPQTIPYGTSTTLTGSAGGGSGIYSWEWQPASLLLNPGAQNPVTVNLSSNTTFILTVSDLQTQCLATDSVGITLSGLPLSLNVIALPDSVCEGASTQLMALANGGSGNYLYNWYSYPPGFSSGIPNPVVFPVGNTTYYASVNDGYTALTGSVYVTLRPLPQTPSVPAGPDTVDLRFITASDYTAALTAHAESYAWELLPADAGTISGSGLTATVTWGSSYLGEAFIHVKGVNTCGDGQLSEARVTYVDNVTSTGKSCLNDGISIFPNPAYDRVHVRIENLVSPVELTVSDVFGKKISGKMMNEPEFLLDLSTAPGIYIITIQFPKSIAIRKIIVK